MSHHARPQRLRRAGLALSLQRFRDVSQGAVEDRPRLALGKLHDLRDLGVGELGVELEGDDVLLSQGEIAEVVQDPGEFWTVQQVVIGRVVAGSLAAAMGDQEIAGEGEEPGFESRFVWESTGLCEGSPECLRR